MTCILSKSPNPHADTYRNFVQQIEEHGLKVIRDDGLYKHLRMQAPGTRIWSWDVVTWPGHLATSGDIADGYVFSRETDMIRFFDRRAHQGYHDDGSPSIDFNYWAEKLCGNRQSDIREYSGKLFRQYVREALAEREDVSPEERDVLMENAASVSYNEHEAREFLRDHQDVFGDAYYDWNLKEFTWQFLYACYAIEKTVREYLDLQEPEGLSS